MGSTSFRSLPNGQPRSRVPTPPPPPVGATPLLRFGLPSLPGVVGMVLAPRSASRKHPFCVVCVRVALVVLCGGCGVGVGLWVFHCMSSSAYSTMRGLNGHDESNHHKKAFRDGKVEVPKPAHLQCTGFGVLPRLQTPKNSSKKTKNEKKVKRLLHQLVNTIGHIWRRIPRRRSNTKAWIPAWESPVQAWRCYTHMGMNSVPLTV